MTTSGFYLFCFALQGASRSDPGGEAPVGRVALVTGRRCPGSPRAANGRKLRACALALPGVAGPGRRAAGGGLWVPERVPCIAGLGPAGRRWALCMGGVLGPGCEAGLAVGAVGCEVFSC